MKLGHSGDKSQMWPGKNETDIPPSLESYPRGQPEGAPDGGRQHHLSTSASGQGGHFEAHTASDENVLVSSPFILVLVFLNPSRSW